MQPVEVSVVIPCYNAGRYIGEAIESVLCQAGGAFQIIIIDDGSTDNSLAVARSFGKKVEIYSQTNSGQSAARNAGIQKARHPLLAFIDADDLWPEHSLAARLEALSAAPDAECVFGAVQQFASPDMDGARARTLNIDETPMVARFAGTMLIQRAAFLRAGPFDPTLRIGEMIEWLARAQLAGIAMTSINRVVLKRRVHGTNTVLTDTNAQAGYLRALKAGLDRRRAAIGR